MSTPAPFAHLLAPLEVGGVTLRNRAMLTTHGPRLSQRRYLRYLHERSKDVALVGLPAGVGLAAIPPGPGRVTPGFLPDADAYLPHPLTEEGRAHYDRFIPVLAEQVAVVHANGARCVGQLHHGGISQSGGGQQPVVGPSAVVDPFRRRVPHVLSVTEIADLVGAYGEAARRVGAAGADGVELHGAHGYLINQFLSPLTNQRTDDYGGDGERRLRFLLEVIAAVREAIGPSALLGVRLPGAETVAGGLDAAAVGEIGRRLAGHGVGYLNISTGNYAGLGPAAGLAYVAPAYVPPGPSVADAAVIRKASGLPVIVAGRINDLATAERIVAEGQADMVGFTRALIADPSFLAKAGRADLPPVRTCIACNECHTGETVACTVNPAAGREEELECGPAPAPKRVVVIGGGPAGMHAARTAAALGHRVTLLESADRLGGALALLSRDPNRPTLSTFLGQLRAGVDAAGVEVRLATVADAATVAALGPERIVVAVGASEYVPALPGIDHPRVLTALAVRAAPERVGGRALVVGGTEDHLAPLTTADLLASSGRKVTLLSELPAPGEGVEPATKFILLRRLLGAGVELRPLTALREVTATGAVLANVLTGAEEHLAGVDSVVLACGRRPRGRLAEELGALRGLGIPMQLVGDCLSPRRMVHAMLDAARAATTL